MLTQVTAFGQVGLWQFLVLVAVVLLLFGVSVPRLARSAGASAAEIKRVARELDPRRHLKSALLDEHPDVREADDVDQGGNG